MTNGGCLRAFTTLCYSADGKVILAGGLSKNVCIYSVTHQLLMKKFEISCNHSLDGIEVGLVVRSAGKIWTHCCVTEYK